MLQIVDERLHGDKRRLERLDALFAAATQAREEAEEKRIGALAATKIVPKPAGRRSPLAGRSILRSIA